jgi:hypothetical protein
VAPQSAGADKLRAQAVAFAQDVAQPPLLLLVDLDETGEWVDGAWIVCSSATVAAVRILNHQTVCSGPLFDHDAHRRTRCGREGRYRSEF